MRFFLRFLAMVAIAGAIAAPAHARWRVAESSHFVVYADDSERDLQRFSEMLERYRSGLEKITGRDLPVPSPSNRLTIYAVGNQRSIARLAGDDDSNVAGFYIPRATGSIAFVQDVRPTNGQPDMSMVVLLHEYAHHFFAITSPFPMPRWMSEGGAEFFASARFPGSGDLEIGRPAHHRAGELFYATEVPIRQLLDYDRVGNTSGRMDALYGRSWLLYHYLTMGDDRAGQMNRYWQAIAGGQDRLEAAEAVFGDLDKLEEDLDNYLRQRRILHFEIPAVGLTIGPVAVRELSDGMDDALPLIIRSKRGVDRAQALELLPEMRAVAAEHPRDAGVLAALAEAEFDAGYDAEAIAAADAAIAIDPSIPNAYVQKGYALFRRADEAGADADYTAALAPFQALNRVEHDHPAPLIYFYRSFTDSNREPTELARHALERALELAPFDTSLRMSVVSMLAQEGKLALARQMLAPVLANPHSAGLVQAAQALDTQLAAGEEGQPLRWNAGEPEDAIEAGDVTGAEGETEG